jgi:putative ABC transport system permease protein
MRSGVAMAIIGISVGTIVSLLASKALESLLFDVTATDPGVIASIVCLLMLVATASSVIPAWKASRVDPALPLRAE